MSVAEIQSRFRALSPFLDERMRRLFAAAESEAIGYGGISTVARATGVSRRAITEGVKELKPTNASGKARPISSRVRRQGGGRKPVAVVEPTLLQDLDDLVDPVTRGDPESPLPLRANIAETLSVVAISEQGEKEDQHDSQEYRPLLHCDVGCGPRQ